MRVIERRTDDHRLVAGLFDVTRVPVLLERNQLNGIWCQKLERQRLDVLQQRWVFRAASITASSS